jgi:hypothetical protein
VAARSLIPPLTDIVEAIERIRGVLGDSSLDAFEADWQKQWLVERGIEIVSEASRRLTAELKARNPDIPWTRLPGSGTCCGTTTETSPPPSSGSSCATIYRRSNASAATNLPPPLQERGERILPVVRLRSSSFGATAFALKRLEWLAEP